MQAIEVQHTSLPDSITQIFKIVAFFRSTPYIPLPGRSVPAFCCVVDGNGEVVDYLRLTNLLKRKFSPMERERKDKVQCCCTLLA